MSYLTWTALLGPSSVTPRRHAASEPSQRRHQGSTARAQADGDALGIHRCPRLTAGRFQHIVTFKAAGIGTHLRRTDIQVPIDCATVEQRPSRPTTIMA